MRGPPRCGYNRRMRVILLVTLAGCATQGAAASPEPTAVAANGWEPTSGPEGRAYDDSGRPLRAPQSYTVAEDRFATVRLSAPPPDAGEARPRGVGKRNIALKRARLDNALRYLAHEGRFNLVVEGDMAEPVTVELRGVEPYDAAMALAEAHNLSVTSHRGIVIVSKSPASGSSE
jgi:hypothetical protein